MTKDYGAGIIEKTAHNTNVSRTSLYEYQAVWMFVWRWKGYSARRIFDDLPDVTHTHYRMAVVLSYEDAIDAIEAIGNGDDEFDRVIAEKGGTIDYPMDTDTFGVYVKWRQGKPLPNKPLFNKTGYGYELLELFKQESPAWINKRLQWVIREMQE